MIKSNLKVGIFVLIATLSIGTISCQKKGCMDATAVNYSGKAKKDDASCTYKSYKMENVTENGQAYVKITGSIDEGITLSSSIKYILSGGVFVEGGATLTIEAGTVIYGANDNTIPFLSVRRGSKIMAIGTENNPIVFTTIKSNPQPGDWGGIILNGYAPVNNGTDPIGEGDTGAYGGTNPTDNSGTMQYVRVEYAGKLITSDKEMNGFSFNGVGSGTTLDHLQAYMSADDGFEFFGGTVNLTNALSYGAQDDSFDFTYGWSGAGTNWVAIQDMEAVCDRGIEGDNNSSNNLASPTSNPTLTNIRLVGRGASQGNSGVKLREGTKANIINLEIVDFAKGVDIEHDVTLENVKAGSLRVSKTTTTNCTIAIRFKGNKNASGNVVNPQLETEAKNSNNAIVDGTASVNTTWIKGSWYRNL